MSLLTYVALGLLVLLALAAAVVVGLAVLMSGVSSALREHQGDER